MRGVKGLIVFVVVFGLWRTIDSARRQLAEQQQSIRSQIAVIDQNLQGAANDQDRRQLQEERERLLLQQPSIASVDRWRIAIAAVIYLVSLFPTAIFFHQTLTHMGQRPRLAASVRAHVLGHMGKYVPGKAMVVILRTGAIAGPDVRPGVAMVAAFIETLLMMAVGGTLAGLLVMALDFPLEITLPALGLAICTAIPTIPAVFRILVRRVAGSRLGRDKGLDDAVINWGLMAIGWGWMLLTWVLVGSAFALIVQASPGAMIEPFTWRDSALCIASISLAMVAGFLSLLPGGAGARELVITTLLAPRFGIVPGLVAAILARVVFLFVEVTIGGLLWLKRPPRAPVSETD
ncbi:MAG: hypothetical protein R3C05_06835 [Pirellulaceae bacterium]